MLKTKGPRIAPWGTPNIKSSQELKTLLIFILCFRFDKQLHIIAKACLLNPWPCNFANNNGWFIMSNALLKSINTPPAKPLSMTNFHFSSMGIRAVCVLYPYLYLHKWEDKCLSIYSKIYHYSLFQMSFNADAQKSTLPLKALLGYYQRYHSFYCLRL